jgi:hypothetical protein
MIDLIRRAKLRPKPAAEDGVEAGVVGAPPCDPEKRELVFELVSWLRTDGRRMVPYGAEVLTFAVNGGADMEYAATKMAILTGSSWTPAEVRAVVDRIRSTELGRALCASVGIKERDDEEGSK